MPNEKAKVLNKEQLAAVRHGTGPLLIIAGAGTGKTTVITERIKWLVAKNKAKPSEILALTFTDKAAQEMEERVDQALPYGYTDMWISTFHAFGDRILRQEALAIGLDPGYKLLTQSETIQFLTDHLFDFKLKYFRPLGNPTKFVGGLLQHFSRLKDEDVTPDEYLAWVKSQFSNSQSPKQEAKNYGELAGAYQQYETLKIKEGVMDFADLISHSLRLWRTRKNILYQYRRQFKYLLVDEFQDTNIAQYALLKLLAPSRQQPNLTVVGDDSQSVYKFRGAAVSNILQFMKEYPRAKQVVLVKNYRSSQTILDHAYQLIKNNNPDTLEIKLGIDKNLKAVRQLVEKPIEFIKTDRVENEAEAVAAKINKLTQGEKKKYDYQDFAILVRANHHAEPFVRALTRAGIPCQFLGPGQLFRQPEVKDLIAYLKLLDNLGDDVALYRVLAMPLFALSARDLAILNAFARQRNLSLFEASEQVAKLGVSLVTKVKIGKFLAMVNRHLEMLTAESAGQILYFFLEETGLLKKLAESKTLAEEKDSQNLAKFFDRLKTYEADHEDASVRAVVAWINLAMVLGESPLATDFDWTRENQVNLLTVHSAKGLEFPVVFLVNLVSERFPTRLRQEQIPIPQALIKEVLPSGDFHEQEERRLFYVGLTRAQDQVFFTAADFYGEGKRVKKISPFVAETLGPKFVAQSVVAKEGQLSFFDYQPAVKIKTPSTARPPLRRVDYLSYSQIETFNRCPLQYRYRFLQRIPVPASGAQSFGIALHQTLQAFYQAVVQGKKPSQKDLLAFLEKNWLSEGYASRAHEKERLKQGRKMLIRFFQKAFNPQAKPYSLEQLFVIKPAPFLKIGGRIDRVDKTKKGLEIIDYKTGKAWDQKEVDQSLQMTVYALAATDQGVFNQKPENVTLSFYFLDKGVKRSTQRSQKQLQAAKKELVKKAQKIAASDFPAQPSRLCDWCEYRLLCEAWS